MSVRVCSIQDIATLAVAVHMESDYEWLRHLRSRGIWA
jgi:hypothetical protein